MNTKSATAVVWHKCFNSCADWPAIPTHHLKCNERHVRCSIVAKLLSKACIHTLDDQDSGGSTSLLFYICTSKRPIYSKPQIHLSSIRKCSRESMPTIIGEPARFSERALWRDRMAGKINLEVMNPDIPQSEKHDSQCFVILAIGVPFAVEKNVECSDLPWQLGHVYLYIHG